MSGKNSVEWHANCLKNMKTNLVREKANLVHQELRCRDLNNDIVFLEHQVESARKEGKDGFDESRYKVKRKKSMG